MRPLFAPSFIGGKKSCIARPQRRKELNPVLLRPFLAPDKQAPGLRFLACQARRGDVRGRVSCILPYERAFFCYSGEHKNVKTLMFACLNNPLLRRSDFQSSLFSSFFVSEARSSWKMDAASASILGRGGGENQIRSGKTSSVSASTHIHEQSERIKARDLGGRRRKSEPR